MENNKTVRITKANRFEDIKALLNGEKVAYGTTKEEAIEFIDYQLELLARKNSGEKKPTQTQLENAEHKERIKTFLAMQTEGVTVTMMQKNILEFADLSNQKIARIAGDMAKAGEIKREVVKGKALFSL